MTRTVLDREPAPRTARTAGHELYHAFAERHGGRPVRDGDRLLFPDGAVCDAGDKFRIEPSEDETARLRSVARYWTVRSEMIQKDFNRWHGSMVGKYGPTNSRDLLTPDIPDDLADPVDLLEWLAAALKEARSELAGVEAVLTPPPTPEDLELAKQQREADVLARELAERRRAERQERINRVLASVDEPAELPPTDPKAMKLLPGKAVTLRPVVADPYDLSEPDVPE